MNALLSFAILAAFGLPASAAAVKGIVIEVAAGAHDRQDTPLTFELPEAWRSERSFTLTEVDTKKRVEAQLDPGPPARVVWILRDVLKAGQTRRYSLAPGGKTHSATVAVSAEDQGKFLFVKIGPRTVMRYNAAIVESFDPAQPLYRRSGYIHPLYDIDGRPVTDDMAPDHAHQHGIMFPYQKATFRGKNLNFWEPSNGTISHERFESVVSGPVFGGFRASLLHDENDLGAELVPVLKESWTVRMYNLTDYVLFDLDSTQVAPGDPLLVEKNAYGGLAIRCHRNWFDPKNSEYLTSEGKTRENGNQTRPRWVDLYGWIDGKQSGVAILDHPGNFNFPQPVRLHPAKPYMCFSPMALGSFQIEAGKPHLSRYRFYVHTGKPDAAKIEMLWRDYAEPPVVREIPAQSTGKR